MCVHVYEDGSILPPALNRRDVALLLSRITPEGALLPVEATFELRVTLTESQGELLGLAREVLSHSGHGRSRFRAGGRGSLRARFSGEAGPRSSQETRNPSSNPGGDHSEDNLTLRCRRHNQAAAEQQLGTGFMTQARSG